MKKAGIFIVILALCVLLTACGEQKAYDEACALFETGRYAEAIEMFRALGDFSDSPDRIKIAETRLEQTSVWRDGGKSEADLALRYRAAFSDLEAGRTREAYEAFSSLGTYRDASAQLEQFTVLKGALVGEEAHVITSDSDELRGTAVYTYGPDGRIVSRSGFCKLDKYGWFENFTYHYEYNENGRPVRELYSDSCGTKHEYVSEYSYNNAAENAESYTEVVENEMFNGHAFPVNTWQESYCEFGVSTVKSESSTLVNHYGADGKKTDSVQTCADGSQYVTTYSYDDVYIYTPAD